MPKVRGHGGHLAGGKFTGSHTTTIPAAIQPLLAAERMAEVKRITLGVVKQGGKCTPGIKVVERTKGYMRVTIRGSATVQEVHIYLHDPEAGARVEQTMQRAK